MNWASGPRNGPPRRRGEGRGREKGNERDWLVFVIPRAEESSRGRVHATIMGRSWLSYSPSTVERNFLNVDRTTTYIVGDKLKLFVEIV